MATEYSDYRGYRLTTTTPDADYKWTAMINPLDALPALSGRGQGSTKVEALLDAQRIVDIGLAPRPARAHMLWWPWKQRQRGVPA
jgi:hypothetical protein